MDHINQRLLSLFGRIINTSSLRATKKNGQLLARSRHAMISSLNPCCISQLRTRCQPRLLSGVERGGADGSKPVINPQLLGVGKQLQAVVVLDRTCIPWIYI